MHCVFVLKILDSEKRWHFESPSPRSWWQFESACGAPNLNSSNQRFVFTQWLSAADSPAVFHSPICVRCICIVKCRRHLNNCRKSSKNSTYLHRYRWPRAGITLDYSLNHIRPSKYPAQTRKQFRHFHFDFRPIEKILLTNDLTEKVLHEACDKGTNLIISYHPPIFTGLKRITQR